MLVKKCCLILLVTSLILLLSCHFQEKKKDLSLPDLYVKDISCMGGNLYLTIGNKGHAPLPENWTGLASLYIDGVIQDDILLPHPTSRTKGGLEKPGGESHYLIPFDVSSSIRVDVYVDYTDEIREANEKNNSLENVYVGPCLLPDLSIDEIYLNDDCEVVVVVENKGPGRIPLNIWTIEEEPECLLTIFLNDRQWSVSVASEFDPRRDLHYPLGKAAFPTHLKITQKAIVTAQIDCSNIIHEQDEENNVKTVVLECPSSKKREEDKGK